MELTILIRIINPVNKLKKVLSFYYVRKEIFYQKLKYQK